MSETLLFLHILAAVFLITAVVMFSAFVLGSPVNKPTRTLAEVLWGVGGLGTLIFGVWLALDSDGYSITDGWIIGAIVLWFLATGAGESAGRQIKAAGDDSSLTLPSSVVGAHWVRTVLVFALLVIMIYKPGA